MAVHFHSYPEINVLLEYPNDWTATFEATLAPGIRGAAVEMCGTEGRLWIDRSRYEYFPKGSATPTEVVPYKGDAIRRTQLSWAGGHHHPPAPYNNRSCPKIPRSLNKSPFPPSTARHTASAKASTRSS